MTLPIFIVSLGDSPRRKHIQQQFRAYSIPYEIFDAIDCRNGVPAQYETLINRNLAYKRLGRHLSNTEIGCALSHHLVYKHILHHNIQQAIIVEDDVILTDNFKTFYKKQLINTLQTDMLFLYHVGARVKKSYTTHYNIKVYPVHYMPYSTAGYYLTAPVAKALLDAGTPIAEVADYPMECTHIFNVQAVYPRIIQHPPLTHQQSYIDTNRHTEYTYLYKKSFFEYIWNMLVFKHYIHNKHKYTSLRDYVTRRFIRGTAMNISPHITGDTYIPPQSLLAYITSRLSKYIKKLYRLIK